MSPRSLYEFKRRFWSVLFIANVLLLGLLPIIGLNSVVNDLFMSL
ncbi:Uncharacterised protein [Enterobacter hormaechei]|nr:Uncharacterised protein [Enterobacter hormaechei]CZV94624.1 Uncharacterised protein [Enterobacter hormaechei]CZY32575.1 Uncharacterised protein [Enterobacter hormaechei]SAB80091.1 Uncharacterised protein [Enterobacter hormaechei]VAC00973.1 Uncharacterised protein [Enterobacter hormaechei]